LKSLDWNRNGASRQGIKAISNAKKKPAVANTPGRTSRESSRDLVFPIYFFDTLIADAKYDHAALLVLESTGSYFSPVATRGFDQTTKHRLRIPREILTQISAIAVGTPAFFDGSERQFIEPFFSIREYGLFSRFCIVPFHEASQLFAFLLIAYPQTEDDQRGDQNPIQIDIEKTADDLFGNYYVWIEKLSAYPTDPISKDYLGKIDSLIEQTNQLHKHLFFVGLDLEALLTSVQTKSSFTDKKRILDDIETMLYSFTAGAGVYLRKTDRDVLLGFPVKPSADHSHVVEHIFGILRACYASAEIPDSIMLSTRTMDSIPATARELFDTL